MIIQRRTYLPESIYGDGSDGDVTISSHTSLSGDLHAENLSIGYNITLNMNGFRIFVKDTCSMTHYSWITNNGKDGNDGGFAGGSGGNNVTYTCGNGGNGGSGGAGTVNGQNGISTTGHGGNGGAGQTKTGAGGSGGSVTVVDFDIMLPEIARGRLSFGAGGGGGGGGGGPTPAIDNGGGGGQGGHVAIVYARRFALTSFNHLILSNGGKGGYGIHAGGDGGGGGGGVVFLVSDMLADAIPGIAAGGGNGHNAATGSNGFAYHYCRVTNEFTQVFP